MADYSGFRLNPKTLPHSTIAVCSRLGEYERGPRLYRIDRSQPAQQSYAQRAVTRICRERPAGRPKAYQLDAALKGYPR
jgi:hypothetical protein